MNRASYPPAATTEPSKYVQTGDIDPAAVETLSQIVAELQCRAANNQPETASSGFRVERHHHAGLA